MAKKWGPHLHSPASEANFSPKNEQRDICNFGTFRAGNNRPVREKNALRPFFGERDGMTCQITFREVLGKIVSLFHSWIVSKGMIHFL